MSGEIFKSDEDLEKAGYVSVAPEVVANQLSDNHRLAFAQLLIEDCDFGVGFRTFVSADGKRAMVVPKASQWKDQINVISFKLDKSLAV